MIKTINTAVGEFLDGIVHVYDPIEGWTTRPAPRPSRGVENDPLD